VLADSDTTATSEATLDAFSSTGAVSSRLAATCWSVFVTADASRSTSSI